MSDTARRLWNPQVWRVGVGKVRIPPVDAAVHEHLVLCGDAGDTRSVRRLVN